MKDSKKMKGGTKMNKKHLLWMIPLSLVVMVTAAWFFSINGGFTMVVDSLPGYASLNLNIPTLTVNTTDGSDSAEGNTKFLLNKDMIVNVSITETYQDLSGGLCLQGQGDCITSYLVESEEGVYTNLNDGEPVSLKAMPFQRDLNATLDCVAYSCPQSRSVEIILTEYI